MNVDTFEFLYKKYIGQIARYISSRYKIVPDVSIELAQDVFSVLWEKRDKLYCDNEKMILSWLYETAKRKALVYIRHEDHMLIDYDINIDDITETYTAKYDDILQTDEFESQNDKYGRYLLEIKEQLSANEKSLFELVVEKELKAKDVAAILEITDVNFRVKWHRLRNKLGVIVKNVIYK